MTNDCVGVNGCDLVKYVDGMLLDIYKPGERFFKFLVANLIYFTIYTICEHDQPTTLCAIIFRTNFFSSIGCCYTDG